MTTGLLAEAPSRPPRDALARQRRCALVGCAAVLLAMCAASLLLGAEGLAPGTVLHALVDGSAPDAGIVRGLRVPRTLIALCAGVALGMTGSVMQGVTRNPLADPGLLGVNAGASLAVVAAIRWLGVADPAGFVWFGFLGAALASLLVYAVAARGPGGPTPFRLALAGAALTAASVSLISVVLLTSRTSLQEYRFWSVGSLSAPRTSALEQVSPFLVAGVVLAAVGARTIDALALGEDTARGLGVHVRRGQLLLGSAVVLMCGSAISMAGPLAFVGLVVAHLARRFGGHDHRWVLAFAALLGPSLLMAADIVGRFVAPPGELEVGIVVAFLGAPVLIALVRRGAVLAS